VNEQPRDKRQKHWFSVPISWKLLGATAVVGTVAAAIAIVGLKRIQTVNRNLTHTVEFLSTNVMLASLLKQDLITATRAERNMMLAHSEDGTQRFAALVDEVLAIMDDRLERFGAVVLEEDRPQLDLFSKKWAEWRKNHQEVRRLTSVDSDIQARNISVGEAREAIDRLERALDTIIQQSQRDLDAAKQAEDFRRHAAATETLQRAAAVSRAALEMQLAERDLILAASEDEMRRYEETFEPLKKQLESRLKKLSEAVGTDETSAMTDVQKAYDDYVDANRRVRNAAGEKTNFLAYHIVYDVGVPMAAECESILDALIERKEQRMQEYRRAGQQAYVTSRNTLLGISIFGIFVGVAFSFYTGHRIARRLSVLSRYAQSIQATGDLSKPTPQVGRDEIGMLAESFEQMRQSLHEHAVRIDKQTSSLAELTKTLVAKNQEMEQFVYTVSHDLKSPLASCKGLLGLLKEDVADRDYDAIVDSAHRLDEATDQLNQIIEDLLMLSRIGRKSLDLTEVDVAALVNELTIELLDRIGAAGAQIEIGENIPKVVADKSDVRRVFENLLTNALKYGRDTADARITVGGTDSGPETRYFVHDDGPGIDPKYHDRVFGLFQRLETDQPGTGLGLASVAKIMSMHGGRAWVESEAGQGATFWVAFPHPPRAAGS